MPGTGYDRCVRILPPALATLGILLPTACVDRAIHATACRDGFLERGEVCFAEATVPLRAGFHPLAMRMGDFDGDSHLDALVLGVTSEGSVTGQLAPGDGRGHLGPAVDIGVFGCSAHPVPGDVDGDAATDLLVDECGPSVLIFAGGSDGFGPPRSVPTGADTRTSAILDVDGDDDGDVMLLGSDSGGLPTLVVALGDGRGAFAAPDASPMPAVLPGFDPAGFGVGDLDEDGHIDALLVDARPTGGFAWARGRGDGTFEPPLPVLESLAPGGAWVRDFDGDDHLDVLVRSAAAPELVLARGDGRGGFTPDARTEVPEPPPIAAALGDIDLDGDDDLLFVYAERDIVEVWLGARGGTFEGPSEIEADGAPEQLALGDLDEDGALDLVVGTFADGGIRVILARP